jgi:hypothetical protein
VEDKREKICLARPVYDHYTYDNDVTTWAMFTATINSGKYSVIPHFVKGSGLCTNRARSVNKARQWGCKWILWVDSDCMVYADSALKLLAHDRDIISGVCTAKQSPYNIHAGYYRDGKVIVANHLIDTPGVKDDLDWVGCGFLLVRTAVFDHIEKPYFAFIGDEGRGEDVHFCLQARKAGYKISIDPLCHVGHVGSYTYTINDMLATRQNMEENRNRIPLLVKPNGGVLVS